MSVAEAPTPCGAACRAPSGPALTRVDWLVHPRFPDQTLLLRSHQGFREISRALTERAAALPPGAAEGVASVGWQFEGWTRAMRSHEHYEEHKLYPYLARRYETTMECLVSQHGALHRAADQVRAAVSARDPGGLAGALDEHRRVLVAHLAEEEEVVIPMLLELAPKEFAAYLHLPIEELLRRLAAAEEPP